MTEKTTTDTTADRLASLGARLADEGFDLHADELALVVAAARRLRVAAVAADVLADPNQPDVARCRAFARVAAAVSASASSSTRPVMTPAA
jgi:hypothetical protein